MPVAIEKIMLVINFSALRWYSGRRMEGTRVRMVEVDGSQERSNVRAAPNAPKREQEIAHGRRAGPPVAMLGGAVTCARHLAAGSKDSGEFGAASLRHNACERREATVRALTAA